MMPTNQRSGSDRTILIKIINIKYRPFWRGQYRMVVKNSCSCAIISSRWNSPDDTGLKTRLANGHKREEKIETISVCGLTRESKQLK